MVRVQDLAEVGMRDALSWAGASFMLASAGLKTVFNQAQWPILHVEHGDRKIAKSLRRARATQRFPRLPGLHSKTLPL